jgi:hypothetical protein
MNKKFLTKICFYSVIGIIILFSFFHHSSLYSPFLNSDDAVVILMIHDYSPLDLYFWEANHFGSLIPLMGQFFYKLFCCSPVASESFAHYLLLIAGFIGFASLFKSKFIQLIFAVVWFLPPLRMIDVLKVSQGEQYALVGIAIFFLNKLYVNPVQRYRLKEHVFLIITTIILIASVWVSDLAMVSVFIIVIIHSILYFKNHKAPVHVPMFLKPEPYYILFGIAAGALFIYFAKRNAISEENFYDFFNLTTTLESLKIFLGTIRDLFLFKIKEPFTSVYAYLLLFALFVVFLKRRNIKLDQNHSKWILIFALDLAFVFIIILTSKWAYLNSVPRRYFVCNYASFWIVFLMTVDSIEELKVQRPINCLIAIIVLLGGLGTIYNFKYISPKHLKPTIKIASEFKSLGKIGIISEYWNSYINSAPDPDNIKATPNDKSLVRKQSYVDSVFSQPHLYVIRDMWMDFFPDTLEQFGYVLLKDGSEFKLADCQVCKYKKIKLHKIIEFEQFKYDTSQVVTENNRKKRVLCFPFQCISCKEKHVVYGPYIPIGIGDYTVRFFIKTVQNNNDSAIALLDVTANYGNIQFVSKKISKNDFSTSGKYEPIDLDFTTSKRYNGIEFRIYFYGNADLYFDHIELIEK